MTTKTNNVNMEIGGGNTYNTPKWYIKGKDNKKFGKYTTQQMIDYFNQGKLNENSTVACTGMKAWAKLKDTELMQYIDIFDEDEFIDEDLNENFGQASNSEIDNKNIPSNINTFAYLIIVCQVLSVIGVTSGHHGMWGIGALGMTIFWILDLRKIKNYFGLDKINGLWEIWGFFIPIVYLFIRSKKTGFRYKLGWYGIGAFVCGCLIGGMFSNTVSRGEAEGDMLRNKSDIIAKSAQSWNNTEEQPTDSISSKQETEDELGGLSLAEKNAIKSARQYLTYLSYSRDGLINQLINGDNYTQEQAEKAVNYIENEVDWNEQAYKSAQQYLTYLSYSRDGLINQLMNGDKYTQEQAEYAVNKLGL